MKKIIAGIALALLLPITVWAQQKESIELRSTAEVDVVSTNAKGEKEAKRVDVGKAKVVPGDTVFFTTTYTNIGKQPADKVVITNPVPEHMMYLDKSAEGKGTKIEFSVDGGKSYAARDKLVVTDAQGNKRTASAADYTHIKWTVSKPVTPGTKGRVSFKAKLK